MDNSSIKNLELSFFSLLNNIFNEDTVLSTPCYIDNYQLAVYENCPFVIKEHAFSVPEKCLVLQQFTKQERTLLQPFSHTKSNESTVVNSYSCNKIVESTVNNNESEWTGCPLEASFNLTLNEMTFETTNTVLSPKNIARKVFSAVPIKIARLYLSLYNIYLSQNTNKETLPLWIPCNGNDPNCTVWMGVHCVDGKHIRIILNCLGPSKIDKLPHLDIIKQNNLMGFSNINTQMTIEAFASYVIPDMQTVFDESSMTQNLENLKESSIIIQCSWTNVNQILEQPNSNAKCNLLISITSGAGKNSAYLISSDLELIRNLSLGLESGEVTWPAKSDHDVLAEIKTLMENLKYSSLRKKVECNINMTNEFNDFQLDSTMLGIRQDQDFTDELWNVLKRCCSYQELKSCLLSVIDVLKTGEIKPVVFRNNTTKIAKMTVLKHDNIESYMLEGRSLLNLLLEIGMEKLRRDFMYIFVQHELATQDQVASFLKPKMPLSKSILELEKLHCVLKLVSICKNTLHFPKSLINTFVREALNYYQNKEAADIEHTFSFPIMFVNAKKLIESLRPTEWQISLKTNTDSYVSHMVYLFCVRPPICYGHVQKISDDTYYCITGRLVQDQVLKPE
ncbi:protein zwilch homolog isoform X2 [Centruroides sculpturatus]|uniref:protein zwilch homolog isoform X2 n=1 Tax=Centruroides sculpturatus TaxID=218467 RepID=UPI000C6DC440|nr:protein zwilch homolog isoform X2 [Centruroides sculpturatus]